MVKIIALFQSVLYLISSLLFIPVLAGLLVIFFYSVYLAGETLGEFFSRRRGEKKLISSFSERFESLLEAGCDDVEVEKLLRIFEEKAFSPLDRLKMLVRIGPSLGLMGTLIPMGTGLAALSQGKIEQLTSSMIIAFTTTVVGLAAAVIAYILATVKQKWIHEDLAFMEYMAERALRDGKIYEKKTQNG